MPRNRPASRSAPVALHGGPSRVLVEWCGGGTLTCQVASSTRSVIQQFEAARRHGKTWVLEDSDHRVHIIDPTAVRYVRLETAAGEGSNAADGAA